MALTWLLLACVITHEWPVPEAVLDEDEIALQEQVEFLLSHPVDLNRATVEDLLEIPWLNPLFAHRIIRMRDSLGGLEKVSQLEAVEGMSRDVYALLAPLVRVTGRAEPRWGGGVSVRVIADTVPTDQAGCAGLGRVRVEQGAWRLAAVAEKDRGERNWADWLGFGLGFSRNGVNVVVGEHTLGSGVGLVFSGPYRRSASGWVSGSSGPSLVRLCGSALENHSLRGIGADLSFGVWRVAGIGSCANRDALLRPDGTVERLVSSGVHDDSLALASRARVREGALGAVLSRCGPNLRVSAAGCGVDYSRSFAPDDSADSFSGSRLGSAGISVEANTGRYRVNSEAAFSTGRGGAGALELAGEWQGLAVEFGAAAYDRRYFAPLGRWRALTGRKSRADFRAGISYRFSGLRLRLRGNTYRDFIQDSLPARVELGLGYGIARWSLDFRLRRSFRLEQERLRTVGLEFGHKPSAGSELALLFADEHSEPTGGKGRMLGLVTQTRAGRLLLAFSAAGFDIRGSGIRMYLAEYGPMRVVSGFGTNSSAWRFGLGTGLRFQGGSGLGFRLGYTHRDAGAFDFGAQVELGLGS